MLWWCVRSFRPQENAHPDGWVDRPRDKTQSALFERYERSRLPHETYAPNLLPLHKRRVAHQAGTILCA